MNTVTPAEPGEKTESPEALLRRTLHVSEWNPSLTLLYFHTPHADVEKNKLTGAALATFKQCKTFSDEQVARWLSLYHPVEVDMGTSDPKTAERLGFKDGAQFAVVDQDLNVLFTSKSLAESENVAAFLKTTIKSDKCTKYWEPIQKQIDEQKAALAKARELVKQEKLAEALEQYKLVVDSRVLVADFWDDAAKEFAKVARKVEQQK
jgi:hypothetical protein